MKRFSALLLVSVFFSTPAHAFVNTDALSESLHSIEQNLGGSSGLDSLLEDLEEAAEESGATTDYLQFSKGGKTVTMWDVPKSGWFYTSVAALVQLGVVSGKEDSSGKVVGYDPAGNVSRPAALKMALLAAGVSIEACGSPSRADAIGHWAQDFVACAEKMDFGLGSRPLNGNASRAEVLHYVLKAFDVQVPEGTPPFADSNNHEYKNDIAYAYAYEIVSGDKDASGKAKGTFRPDDPINRAEVAKIVKLAIENL